MKKLNIDCYADGYMAGNTSCVDLPIAGASGYYNYENYYYYSFYYAVLSNYSKTDKSNFIEKRKRILNKLGLELVIININDQNELFYQIYEKIDSGKPIIWVVNYMTLFYLPNHYMSFNAPHGLVISGYDKNKSVLLIREHLLTEPLTKKYFRGHALTELSITYDNCINIWEKSNQLFIKSKDEHENRLYYLEQTQNYGPIIYNDVVKDFLKNYIGGRNEFIEFLSVFKTIEIKKKDSFWERVRRNYSRQIEIIFDVIEKALIEMNDAHVNCDFYNKLKTTYMETRNGIINTIHVNTLRDKNFDLIEYIDNTYNQDEY